MSVDDKYTYPGSGGVLRNRLDIRDRDELNRVMNTFASTHWAALRLEDPRTLRPDFDYLKRVHRTMFGHLLTWAGEIRDVDVQAGDSGVVYARPAFVEGQSRELFETLGREGYLSDIEDRSTFADALAERWGDLTIIHPFRDGNTRSQSLYVSQLAVRAGHPIRWGQVDVDRLRELRLAAIARPQPLARYLEELMQDPEAAQRDAQPRLAGSEGPSAGSAARPGSQGRVPPGSPAGGQYSAWSVPESDVELD